MKYNARACHFNMATGCMEPLLWDGRKISIDCTGVEDALDISVGRSILMESLYFYNFLYGSFIYSMLIFMHTDR